MHTTEDSGDGPTGRQPFARDKQVVTPRASRFAGTMMVVVMLVFASGVIALECGFYKAFDDNWLKLDASAASLALALFGSDGAGPDARAHVPSPAGPLR